MSQYQDFSHGTSQRLASFPRKPCPSSERSSERPQATQPAPLEQRKLCWHWNVSCTPRESSSNLFIIHKRVGLIPKVPWEVIQSKKKKKKNKTKLNTTKRNRRNLDLYQDIASSTPWTTAETFRNKALPREQILKKSTENVFSFHLSENVYWFWRLPSWQTQTKTGGKIHILCTVRADMPCLLNLSRRCFCYLCKIMTSNIKSAEKKII